MDFPLQDSIVKALKNEESWNSGLNQLYQTIANDFQYADPYNLVTFADNHDMSRIYTQLNEELNLYKMTMSYLLTMRGIPQVFYGTEILMSNPGTDDHGVIRSDFPGGWQADKANAFSGRGLTDAQLATQSYLKKLLNWRKTSNAVHQGTLTHFAPSNGVYVYFRVFENETVMVVMNKNKQTITINPQDYVEVIADKKTALNVMNQQSYSLDKPLFVEQQSVTIWQLNE